MPKFEYKLVNGIKTPAQLADAWECIYEADRCYHALKEEAHIYLYKSVEKMITEHDLATNDTTIKLPKADDLLMSGKPKKLISNIFEELRKALDYMIVELSKHENGDIPEHVPEFIICRDRSEFKRRNRKLCYLSRTQKYDFVEKLQPYHGNYLLSALRKYSSISKHRRALIAENVSELVITVAEPEQKNEIAFHHEIRLSDVSTVLVQVKSCDFILENDLRLWALLEYLVAHVSRIVKKSHCFFEGKPFKISITYPPAHALEDIRKVLDS